MKSAKQERPLWAQASLSTVKGLLMFGIGLGLTLAAVTARWPCMRTSAMTFLMWRSLRTLSRRWCGTRDTVTP
ncbi:protein of unknown function [Pseudorhizobium banfieldiae]|uniref:Uncharacterized protein n=1 Tax=Pseudorhizobium banfieldiae TaxID=1125847 RepID=L0NL81_9HYPH|nr:protein of unknown function [Pseudorhizobium banfieldiae]